MKASDMLRLIQADGCYLVATRGSHRQFERAGKPSDALAPGTLNSILIQARLKSRGPVRYAIVIEKADSNYSA